jgi:hypothetical protein
MMDTIEVTFFPQLLFKLEFHSYQTLKTATFLSFSLPDIFCFLEETQEKRNEDSP